MTATWNGMKITIPHSTLYEQSFKKKTSLPLPVIFGVPRESVLGPLLFFICMNVLSKVQINWEIISYADDTVTENSTPKHYKRNKHA